MNTTHETRGDSARSFTQSNAAAKMLLAVQGAIARVSNRPVSRWMKGVAGLGGVALLVVLATMAAMPAGVRRTPVRDGAVMEARAAKHVMTSSDSAVQHANNRERIEHVPVEYISMNVIDVRGDQISVLRNLL